MGLALAGAGGRQTLGRSDSTTPILALFPYDGIPAPTALPDRVILRLEDYDRLKTCAEAGKTLDSHVASALRAHHQVTRRSEREALIETDLELLCVGASCDWTFPIENSREITATLDDLSVPVTVEAGGKVGSVRISGEGKHRLRLRRTAPLQESEIGDVLVLPVNPVVSSRVGIDQAASALPIELPTARGRIESTKPRLEALLGPSERLEVRWLTGKNKQPAARSGTVEALLLWDSEPAGDRVRAHLTYHNPKGTSIVRLGLEPGLMIRSTTLPGLVEATWQGTEKQPEWVAYLNPPLADGVPIDVEFWRPLPVGADAEGEVASRRLPSVEVLGVERFTGSIGFRRPADWVGRLSSLPGLDPISDEAFVRAWGNLPGEPLTLSGASRFARVPGATVRTGPIPSRLKVQSAVVLGIESGRITLAMEADLVELSGRTYQVELEVPSALRVVSVGSDGLTEWSRVSPTRLRLRYDGAPVKQRHVHLDGWLPMLSNPLATGEPSQVVETPWPRWLDVEAATGTLRIVSPTPFQLEQAPGAVRLDATSYRVERPESLGRLRWDIEPPRVSVLVESQVTVHRGMTDWVAVVRYDVSGGGYDTIHLKLPKKWAEHAEVKVIGDSHQLTSETREDSTFWTIRPEHPIWSSQRILVRSSLPRPQGDVVAVPDLVPLGQGLANTFLSIVNATGQELHTEGSAGLQPIDDSTRFNAEEFVNPLPGIATTVYHVRKEGWSLKIEADDKSKADEENGALPAISLADVFCDLSPDGSTMGSATYQIRPRSGPFLAFELQPGMELCRVSVNDEPVRPLRAKEPGKWLVPLEDASTSQVDLIWKATSEENRTGGRIFLPRPAVGKARFPTLLTVRQPGSIAVAVKDQDQADEAVAGGRLEIEKAEWQERQIKERLATFDRTSQMDREILMASLLKLGLTLRSAERAAAWDPYDPGRYRSLRSREIQERASAVRTRLADALETSALEEYARTAAVHLGTAPPTSVDSEGQIPEPQARVRPRQVGQPHWFLGEIPSIIWSRSPGHGTFTMSEAGALAALLILFSWLVGVVVSRLGRTSPWWGRVALLVALAALTVALGPWALAAGGGMSFLGRATALRPT